VNIPILLTFSRLIISPVLLPFLLVYLLPYDYFLINTLLTLAFALLAATDFFDGYLARLYQQETLIGRLLDPLADKFLTCSTIIALIAINKLFFYWGIVFIGRELFVMGLRENALAHNFSIPVSWAGKVKTTLLMICLGIIILNPYSGTPAWAKNVENIFLFAALFSSVYSAFLYYRIFFRKLFDVQD